MAHPHFRHQGGPSFTSPEENAATNGWDRTSQLDTDLVSSEGGGTAIGALLPVFTAPKPTISDRMGPDVVTLIVGEEPRRRKYTVHKNLLRECGGILETVCGDKGPGNDTVMLNNEDPDALKLFINLIYSNVIAAVQHDCPMTVQASQLVILVRFYVFLERYQIIPEVRDKVMDNIQDGFYMIQKLPESSLIKGVYVNSGPGTMLRKFCAASLVYHIHSQDYVHDGSIPRLLTKYDELLVDFLDAVRAYVPSQDPRIRHCRFKDNCIECERAGGSDYLKNLDGVAPCQFHVHTYLKDAAGEPACHLWRPTGKISPLSDGKPVT